MPKNSRNRWETTYTVYDILYHIGTEQWNFLEIIMDDSFRPFEAIPNWNFQWKITLKLYSYSLGILQDSLCSCKSYDVRKVSTIDYGP